MENATRALLIAGSVLLGIMVLSLFMIMVNNLTDYQQSNIQNKREAETIRFNNQFEGYIREDVSGADILSLINKVTFYNRTKSLEGVEDEGADYGYQPITLKISFGGNQNKLTNGTENKLFTGDMEFNSTNKDGITNALNTINSIVNSESEEGPKIEGKGKKFIFTEGILQSLSENYANGKIFDDDKGKYQKIFADFNACVGKYYFPYNDLKEDKSQTLEIWYNNYIKGDKLINGKTLKDVLDWYYEYSQFKRAKFKWEPQDGKPIYNTNTGRIVYMEFKFTGNFI